MATEEWVKRAILSNKLYEELPPRVRALLPLSDWKAKVKEHCVQRGLAWHESLATTATTEAEYYEDLLRFYRYNYRLFPYHLADYVCRVLRIAPFRYYCDLLFTVLREEKSYDQIPNFTAADIVRLVGIGRNEFISIMNKCKAKKLLWRVNKSIAKEFLPDTPLDIEMQPWWRVGVVNLGEAEYRQLSPEELSTCQQACNVGGACVQELDGKILQTLYKRGLIYLDVPIRPDDHVSIPPLEGFVSNKDSEKDSEKSDPLEALLYAVFVATSARANVMQLAQMLSVELPLLQTAISVACRLGFGTRLPGPDEGSASPLPAPEAVPLGLALDLEGDTPPASAGRDAAVDSQQGQPAAGLDLPESAGSGQGIALVVDAEVTSYLMMGALSPALKRHSVTLFEGGRVYGEDVIAELITELLASVEAASGFEGEMQHLATYAKALACALECVRRAGAGRPVELLRKESLAGLAPAAACRVLSHAYAAVVPITPLPYPPLLLNPSRPGPTNFGPTAEAATPWLQLALYTAMRAGPPSVVFVCGQRIWRLPPQLATASHVLLWPWNLDAVRAQAAPVLVEATFLLFTLNEYLTRTAVMVQPMHLSGDPSLADLVSVDIPLPAPTGLSLAVDGVDLHTGAPLPLGPLPGLAAALAALGLEQALGVVRLLQVASLSNPGEHAATAAVLVSDPQADARFSGAGGSTWVPLQLQLGLPLLPSELCELVCRRAGESCFLAEDRRAAHTRGQHQLQGSLYALISEFGACSNCLVTPGAKEDDQLSYVDQPIQNLYFDGSSLHPLDFCDYQQGVGTLLSEHD